VHEAGLTRFLNVDLDLEGRARDLAPLAAELDRRLLCLHSTVARGQRRVSYEARRGTTTVDRTLRALLAAVEGLGAAGMEGWRAARRRDFDVGIQAGRLPHASAYDLAPATLARVAALGGRIVVTVVAPFPRPRAPR
jgi:hypothetical protein